MPHIVKSSLSIEPTIVAWNRAEEKKLIEEKQEYLNQKAKTVVVEEEVIISEKEADKLKNEDIITLEVEEVVAEEEKENKSIKKNKKAGDK